MTIITSGLPPACVGVDRGQSVFDQLALAKQLSRNQ